MACLAYTFQLEQMVLQFFRSKCSQFINYAYLQYQHPYIETCMIFSRSIFKSMRLFSSMFPEFVPFSNKDAPFKLKIIHSSQLQLIPEKHREEFKKKNKVQVHQNQSTTAIVCQKSIKKQKIKKSCFIQFSNTIQSQSNFVGIASKLLASPYVFSRKQKKTDEVKVELADFKDKDYVIQLVNANLRAREWVNMRGDQADPAFFLQRAQQIANKYNLQMTTIKGSQLVKEGFRLMHAVGRASQKQPIFINLSYKGNPDSQEWTAFVGKGVCFDSGGLNLKPTAGIKQMHMDKHGAASVLSAIESAAKLNLKVNLTASMGFVQNFVSSNSYRPLDIIKSRKGLAVEIGNTDAEGRLVLADCMHWTQQKYKVTNLIQLSTLTGAIVVALGKKHAGLFSNSDELSLNFIKAGEQVEQQSWRMPVDEYHHDLIKAKHADITNSPGKPEAASCQAAAFLQNFVEKGVQWIHLDIAGTSNIDSEATGFGAKSLINYLKSTI